MLYSNAFKLAVLLTVIASFVGCSVRDFGYSFDYQGVQASRTQTGTISQQIQQIEISNRWGNIQVEETTSDQSEATWTWSGTAWGDTDEDAAQFLSELDMIVSESDGTQTFDIAYPEKSRELRGIKSHLTLRVPQGTNVTITNRHGDIEANTLAGTTVLQNRHGKINVDKIMGPLTVKNNHGQTNASNLLEKSTFDSNHGSLTIVNAEQGLDVSQDHGSLTIDGCQGAVVVDQNHGSTKIKTASTVSAGSDHTISAKSNHGSLKIEVLHQQVSAIIAKNNHGSIRISLPKEVTTNLNLQVSHGSKESDFPHDSNGSVSIQCDNNHGNIKIKKR